MLALFASTVHDRLAELPAELAEAVAAERFAHATALRDERSALRRHTVGAVLDAHAQFYAALRAHDAAALDALWEAESPLATECTRVYPGFPALLGRDAILATWRDVSADRHTHVSDVRCVVLRGGSSAVVTCVETRRDGRGMPGDEDDLLSTTNILEKREPDDCWRVVLHRASPLAAPTGADDDVEVDYGADDFPGATG